MGDLFGGDTESADPQPLMFPWQEKKAQRLAKLGGKIAFPYLRRAKTISEKGLPFETLAKMPYEADYEKTLADYLTSDLPTETGLWGNVQQYLGEATADPSSTEYFRSYKANMSRLLKEAKDRLAGRASASDQLFGGGRLKEEAKMETDVLGNLAQMLAGIQKEAVSAVPSFLAFGEAAPGARLREQMELGPAREQRELDDVVKRWLYQQGIGQYGVDLTTAMSTFQPAYSQPTYGPSGASQLTQPLSQLLAAAGQAGMFGGSKDSGSSMIGGQDTSDWQDWAKLALMAAGGA